MKIATSFHGQLHFTLKKKRTLNVQKGKSYKCKLNAPKGFPVFTERDTRASCYMKNNAIFVYFGNSKKNINDTNQD